MTEHKVEAKPRFSYVQFCDDIRRELGNKTTLVGLYNGLMLFPAFPAFIPCLGINLVVDSPAATPVKSLSIKISNGTEIILEMTPITPTSNDSKESVETSEPTLTRSLLNMQAMLQAISIVAPCFLTVTAVIDGVESTMGKLRVALTPANSDILSTV